MFQKNKALIAGAILATIFSTSLGTTFTTPVAHADGMAWREYEDNGDYSGLREDQAQYIKNLERAGKYDKAARMKQYYRNKNRGNKDNHDGMAWREREDQIKRDRRPRTRRHPSNNDGMAYREREDKNGMRAFNETHGR